MSENRETMTDRPTGPHTAAAFGVGLVLLLGAATRFSPAQTSMQVIRWKEFSYAKHGSQVGGRMTTIDSLNRTGFIALGEGEFARLSGSFVFTSSVDGQEFYQGFVMYDFEDGATILAKVDVSGPPGGKQAGTIVFLAGTGRFKGIAGRGAITSWMPAKWDLYAEVEASYSVSAD